MDQMTLDFIYNIIKAVSLGCTVLGLFLLFMALIPPRGLHPSSDRLMNWCLVVAIFGWCIVLVMRGTI